MAREFDYPVTSRTKRWRPGNLTGGLTGNQGSQAYLLLRVGLWGLAITGTASVSQAVQSLAASGTEAFTATAAMTQAAQSMSVAGDEAYTATADMSQAVQILSATGTVISGDVEEAKPRPVAVRWELEQRRVRGSASVIQDAAYVDCSGDVTKKAAPVSRPAVVIQAIGGSSRIVQEAQVSHGMGAKGKGIVKGRGRMRQGSHVVAAGGVRSMAEKNRRELMTIMWLSKVA